MKKRIMTLMAGMLLLLTACGQTRDNSTSTMLPVAAVQSAAQAIVPVEGNFAVTERANTFWVGHITVRQHAYEILRGEYTLLEDELGL